MAKKQKAKSFYLTYLVVAIATILTGVIGSWITTRGMFWYGTLNLPEFTPAGSFIGMVWTVIFILSALSVIMFLQSKADKKLRKEVIGLFIANALFNILWSVLFFGFYNISSNTKLHSFVYFITSRKV